jgi:nitronate monooxygenase
MSKRSLNINFFCHVDPGDVSSAGANACASAALLHCERPRQCAATPGVPYSPFGPEQLDLVLRHRPRVVSFHFGLPQPELLRQVRSSGAFVISSATTVAEAWWLDAQGADAVIAQGLDAGGDTDRDFPPHAGGPGGSPEPRDGGG